MTDETLFAEALERGTTDERSAYLQAACPDPDQRGRVASLLAAHDAASGFLDPPADVTRAAPAGDAGTRTVDPNADEPADEVNPTAFLAPPGRPDSLGRIGHYDVLEVLGQGGFGIVYRAFDEKLQRVVAVKVMAPHLAVTSPARKRFLREARSSAAVRHENVVQVHAVEESPLPFLVMEYVPGETLQQRIDRTGPLDLSDCLRIGRQVADGLAAAHDQGLIHRDIKPSNILTDAGPHPTAKITDFGLARAVDDASLTRSGTVAGTPMYMAPEQAKGEALDHRADLFSLGSVLYVMATGRPPFRANSTLAVLKRVSEDDPRPIREIIPEVPDWYCRVVEKLHAKHPADRFQSAREVAELLADCEKQLADQNRLTDTSRIPTRAALPVATRPRGVPMWAWLLIALAGLFVVGCIGLPVAFMLSWMTPTLKPYPQEPQGDDAPDRPAMAKGDEFTPLFNGKDLRGWELQPGGKGEWAVKDGALVGTGNFAFLQSKRTGLKDFHLRAECKLVTGVAAVIVREQSPITLSAGYEVQVAHGQVGDPNTGSIVERHGRNAEGSMTTQGEPITRPNEWFTLEVIVHNNRAETRVNGRAVAARVGIDAEFPGGTICLAAYNGMFEQPCEVHFRNLWLGELRPDPAEYRWVALDYGGLLQGWECKSRTADLWTWGPEITRSTKRRAGPESGDLACTQRTVNASDFELEVQTRCDDPTDTAGVVVGEYTVLVSPSVKAGTVIRDQGGRNELLPPLPPAGGGAPPTPKAFNRLVVRWSGGRLTTRVNGITITDADLAGGRFDGKIQLRVLDAKPNSGAPKGQVYFDNVQFRKLPPASSPPPGGSAPPLDTVLLKGDWVVASAESGGKTTVLKSGEEPTIRIGDKDITITSPTVRLTGNYRVDPVRRELQLQDAHDPAFVPIGYRFEGARLRLTLPAGVLGDLVSSDRDRSLNNLKALAVAAHNYDQVYGTLPPAGLPGPKGNTPLLSWRVALLPFLEEDKLYKEFKHDEPWDSEHNKKLIPKMPKVFALAGVKAPEGHTHYRAFTGPGTVFETGKDPRKGVRLIPDILDGTVNTLLFVEAAESTTWTKPDDLPFDPKKPLPKLREADGGANAVFCDGSLHTLTMPLKDDTLRALVTRNGGEDVTAPEVPRGRGASADTVLECVRPAKAK